jgi:phosphoribosyl 1,2-cyclic phosphodiesterase
MNALEFRKKVRLLLRDACSSRLKDEEAVDEYLDTAALPGAMTFGGNTPCVEVSSGVDRLVFDCGTGIRELGWNILSRDNDHDRRINIFQSHTHWDHIMGFPFLAPALSGGYSVHIYGLHPDLRGRFEAQMDRIHFPITLEEMRSEICFHQIGSGETVALGPFRIGNMGLHHPGGSWAYRISAGGKNIVFATDGEYRDRTDAGLAPFIDFYRNADLLIFDAMYPTLEQTIEKEDYGHSTAVIGVDLALRAGVKTLALFHHDPESDDCQIAGTLLRAREYLGSIRERFPESGLQIVAAYDGMVIEV